MPAMKTVEGDTLTLVESLLARLTVTPVAGATVDSLTWNGIDWPTSTDRLDGTMMPPNTVTVTLALAPEMFAFEVLALIVVFPFATAVTGT